MESIIEKLYDLHLKTAQFPFGIIEKELTDNEWRLYATLYNNLPTEQKKLFTEYVSVCADRHKQELKAIYGYAFKTAVQLLTECVKD